MFCRKCGNEIPDDSEFCPKCGASLKISPEVKQTSKNEMKEEPKVKPAVNLTTDYNPQPDSDPSHALYGDVPKTDNTGCIGAVVIAIIAAVYVCCNFISCEDKKPPVSKVLDEDAAADQKCKNDNGFSNIFACRRAIESKGIDPDIYVREKWNPYGNKIKGIGFCEGTTYRGKKVQYKIHYAPNCHAKELWVWDDDFGDFKEIE